MPLIDLNGLGHFKDRENAMIAENFAATKDYAAGDYCYFNGTLKKFKTAHAAGAWIGTDAEDAKLAGDVSSLKESINNNILEEDSSNHVWVQGAFNRISGNAINTTKAIRNYYWIKEEKNIAKIVANSGYKMSLWAWDEATNAQIDSALYS